MNSLMSELYAGEAPIRSVDELAAIYYDGKHQPELSTPEGKQLDLISGHVQMNLLGDNIGV